MRVRNPFVAALLVIAALGALAVALMIGFVLLAVVAVAGVALTAGMVIRRKIARARGDLPPSRTVRARLDPAMEVHPEPRRIPTTDSSPPESD
jgi:uncharacterized protein (DUF58 family)